MTTYSLTLQEAHLDELKSHILRPDQREGAAYLLCGISHIESDPWGGEEHIKLLSREFRQVPPAELIEATTSSVTWRTDSFVCCLKEAKQKSSQQVVAIVHSHPRGPDKFSAVDDANERDLWQLAANRNGSGTIMISLLVTGNGELVGRVWRSRKVWEPLRIICVIGVERIRLYYPGRGEGVAPLAFHRQALAFGPALGFDLQQLRVAIIGLGGTGSPTALMAARMGIGQIALFDKDIVDRTNLNRLHGSRQSDADAMRNKVDVLRREISEMGLGVRVVTYPYWIGDMRCRDAIKACDIIFACTDDDDGRLLLNRFAYFYLTPVFDLGLAIKLTEDGENIESLDGRVTVIAPGQACLLCRGIISSDKARDQALRRENPSEYDRRKLEAYVQGEGDPNPAVITFTTETATMALNEFLHRLHGFRGSAGATAERRRQFHRMHDIRAGEKPIKGCPICDQRLHWGHGDVNPFLDRVG